MPGTLNRLAGGLHALDHSLQVTCSALALLLLMLGCAQSTNPGGDPLAGFSLEKVVLLERHGVRSPTKPPEAYAQYSTRPWADWPVAPGELTDHGAEAARIMGSGLRQRYAELGLLSEADCPPADQIFVWADGTDQRTRATGAALLSGFAPGCALHAQYAVPGTIDPIFAGAESGLCPIDAAKAAADIAARMDTILDERRSEYASSRTLLQWILTPAASSVDCSISDAKECLIVGGKNVIRTTASGAKLEGPLGLGSTLTENLLLEFYEGFPAEEVGWGRASSMQRLTAILPLHELRSDLTERILSVAARNGTFLARQLLDAMGRRPTSHFAQEVAVPASAVFIAFIGHDTNLYNLAAMLGIDWQLAEQPDKTAPDTGLAFEVWRNPQTDERVVRVKILYQTMAGLRELAPLDADHPLPHVTVALPDCGRALPGTCTLEELARHLEAAMAVDCLH